MTITSPDLDRLTGVAKRVAAGRALLAGAGGETTPMGVEQL